MKHELTFSEALEIRGKIIDASIQAARNLFDALEEQRKLRECDNEFIREVIELEITALLAASKRSTETANYLFDTLKNTVIL